MSPYETLEMLGLANMDSQSLFAHGTRDDADLKVWRDDTTGVIYLDGDCYVGDKAYQTGTYRTSDFYGSAPLNLSRVADCARRVKSHKQFLVGKDICDFGCGVGDFITEVQPLCRSVSGVELELECVESLNARGISCCSSLTHVMDNSLDAVFLFHTLEHLPDPIDTLNAMKGKIRDGGKIIIEVPHAGDFLLRDDLMCEEFRKFTLWSQHQILHTRGSLNTLLKHCGFDGVVIEGVQRYPLSNHLHWLGQKKPGGHASSLSIIETDSLREEYEKAMCSIDATDTIVAIATARKDETK